VKELRCDAVMESKHSNLPCDPLNIEQQLICVTTIIKFTIGIITVAVQKQFEVTAKLLQEYRGLFRPKSMSTRSLILHFILVVLGEHFKIKLEYKRTLSPVYSLGIGERGLSPLFWSKCVSFRRSFKNYRYGRKDRRSVATSPFPKLLLFWYRRLDRISGGDALTFPCINPITPLFLRLDKITV